MARLTVEVTQEDIDLGGHSAHNCPISRAATRALEETETVGVTHDWLCTYTHDMLEVRWHADFPTEVSAWLLRYDVKKETMEPCSFEIEVPDSWQE